MTTIFINDGIHIRDDYFKATSKVEWEQCGMYDLICTENIRYKIANLFKNKKETTEEEIKKAVKNYFKNEFNTLIYITTIESMETIEDWGIKIK